MKSFVKIFCFFTLTLAIYFIAICFLIKSPFALAADLNALGSPDGNICSYTKDVLGVAEPLVGGLAMLKIIYGGVMYATAAGNPKKMEDAKSHIYYALTGILILIFLNLILALLGVPSLSNSC